MALASPTPRDFSRFAFSAAIWPLALLCLGVASPVQGADTAAVVAADTVVVSARALGDAVTPSAAGLTTVVDLTDESGQSDLADVLGRTAGFQVRRYGGLGFAAVPSLRGSAAAQIRIFIDGLPLDDAQSGTVDLSLLPVERFSRVEIHRGVVPGGLGGMGGAGAVNLITRPDADGVDVSAFAGGFGSLGGRATWGVSGDDGRRSLLLMAHGRRADNDYEYLDNYQTFDETGDDTTRTRRNAAFEEWGVWGSGRLGVGSSDLHFTGGLFRKDGGRPGPINYPTPTVTVRLDRADGQVQADLPHAVSLVLAANRVEQVLYDPHNEIDDGFTGDIRSLSTDRTGRLSWSPAVWRAGAADAVLSRVDLIAGADLRRQDYRQWYGVTGDPQRNRETRSAFASLPVGLFSDRLQVTPAWRYQRNADDFPPLPAWPGLPEAQNFQNVRHDVSPSVGLAWEVTPDTWFVEAHLARSVRIPTWVELFGHRGGIDGNRDLRPETITAADVAVVWRPSEQVSSRLAAFRAETDETIIFVQNSVSSSQARNIGATVTRGLEWEGRVQLTGLWRLDANATWQRAEDEGHQPAYRGNRLPYLSDLEIAARLAHRGHRWRPWLEVSHESPWYRDRANTPLIESDSRTLWNLGVTRLVGDSLEVSAEVINLTDDRTYDMVQFPLPGRTWQLALRATR